MIRSYTASMPGPSHIAKGIPNQDACRVAQGAGGAVIAAVADGLGSEKFPDVGAQVAIRSAVEYCRKHYRQKLSDEQVQALLHDTFLAGYAAVIERAKEDENPVDQYDCTLALAIWDAEQVYYGQAGDSGIVALLKDGRYQPVTRQQRNREGDVFPLSAGPRRWEFGQVEEPVSALMLMTDGVWDEICPGILKRCDVPVNVPLAQKFMEREEDTPQAIGELTEAVTEYLKNYPVESLSDDKTVVVLYDPQSPPARQPEAYYAPPDWDELYRVALERILSPEEPLQPEETQPLNDTPMLEEPEGLIAHLETDRCERA